MREQIVPSILAAVDDEATMLDAFRRAEQIVPLILTAVDVLAHAVGIVRRG